MLLETLSTPWAIALSTDATNTSFPSRIPTATEPSGNGVIDCGGAGGGICQNGVKVLPFAVSGDDDTFSMRIIAWERVGSAVGTLLWIPSILVELGLTCSTMVGVAGKVIGATYRFADTMTLVSGNDDISVDIVSPTGNVAATAVLDLKGAQKIEFTFDSTAAGTTAMNCLYKFI